MDINEVHHLNKKFDVIYDYRAISNIPKLMIKDFFVNISKIMNKKSFLIFKLYSKKWLKNQQIKRNIGKSKNIFLTTFNKRDILKIIPKRFKIVFSK